MTMRDLIPWGRQESRSPTPFPQGRSVEDPLGGLRRSIDRIFDDFFAAPALPGGAMRWPSVELRERDDEVVVTAELPGLREEDVELTLEDGFLAIRGEKGAAQEDRDRGWSERFYGRFERRIALPAGVEEDKAKAEFRDGLLTVTLPRDAQAQSGRRIPIGGGTRH